MEQSREPNEFLYGQSTQHEKTLQVGRHKTTMSTLCDSFNTYRIAMQDRRIALGLGALTTSLVLICNIMLLWYATRQHKIYGYNYSDVGIVQQGDCDAVQRFSNISHIIINILSTLLLGASNFAMQCLVSPTRNDIDKAHLKGIWLDIGIPSIKNLRHISVPRLYIWLLLGLSSIPLHLMYNSVIFASLSSIEYTTSIVTQDFIDNVRADPEFKSGDASAISSIRNATSLHSLTAEECVTAFNSQLVTTYTSVIFVVQNISEIKHQDGLVEPIITTKEDLDYSANVSLYSPQPGHLSGSNYVGSIPQHQLPIACFEARYPNGTSLGDRGGEIKSCLVTTVPERCQLNYSAQLLMTVIILNIIKIFLISLTALKYVDGPLVTVGDAIQSFLNNPDVKTKGLAFAGYKDFAAIDHFNQDFQSLVGPKELYNDKDVASVSSLYQGLESLGGPLGLISEKDPERVKKSAEKSARRWFRGASPNRWMYCLLYCYIVWIVGVFLCIYAATSRTGSWANKIGFVSLGNTISNRAISSTLGVVVLANLPQVAFSFVYLSYNALATSLLANREYISYSQKRKRLRLSEPRIGQKSTYYLQIPYRYGIPLMIWSSSLHYLISQSLFIVRVNYYDANDVQDLTHSLNTLGYSVLGIISVLIVGGMGVVLIFLLGFRRYPGLMPIGGTCSAAIAAACWRPESDIKAATQGVKWGEISGNNSTDFRDVNGEEASNVRHLCFTSFPVTKPQARTLYM